MYKMIVANQITHDRVEKVGDGIVNLKEDIFNLIKENSKLLEDNKEEVLNDLEEKK